MSIEKEAKIEDLLVSDWGWYHTNDDEHYHGPHATREEVLAEYRNCTGSIAYCERKPLRLSDYFAASEWLERAEEDNEELQHPDGDCLVISNDARMDLHDSVVAAIDAWQVRNQLVFYAWHFNQITEVEKINEDNNP